MAVSYTRRQRIKVSPEITMWSGILHVFASGLFHLLLNVSCLMNLLSQFFPEKVVTTLTIPHPTFFPSELEANNPKLRICIFLGGAPQSSCQAVSQSNHSVQSQLRQVRDLSLETDVGEGRQVKSGRLDCRVFSTYSR